MFFDKNFRAGRPLPSDITLRVSVYSRRGVVAALVAGFLKAWNRWQEKRELSRLADSTRFLPDYLREDIGLPPAPPQPWIGRDPLRW